MTQQSWLELPELQALDTRQSLIRIPNEIDVPLTPRVRQIVDTPEFRRLARISQLGLVSLVYPAAHHSRFEHSLGVYRLTLIYLKQLAHDARFTSAVSTEQAEVLIVASLLHDLGHWPFCHPIEDIRLPGVPRHEMFANSFLLEGELADVLRDDWGIQPREVVAILSEKPRDTAGRILQSILSGPIDVDKMDYLQRDSLHAGVPYGRNFDHQRLIGSLCLNRRGDGLAITEKGRTAAEMMVFARYVMFSEVYWHHAVRSATAMLQRVFYLMHGQIELDRLFRCSEQAFVDRLREGAEQGPGADLLEGLFGPTRQLYKRAAQYSFFQDRALYKLLAGQPYPWLVACGEALASSLSRRLSRRVAPDEILLDAPPVKREIEFNIDVYFPKEDSYRTLSEVSPVVDTLATKQFDDCVKCVRLFVHPSLIDDFRNLADLSDLLREAVEATK